MRSPLPEVAVVRNPGRSPRNLALELPKGPLHGRAVFDLAGVDVPDMIPLGLGFLPVLVKPRDVRLVPQIRLDLKMQKGGSG